VSTSDKQAVNAVHHVLMERFPNAFPKNYDQILPLKTGIHADLVERLPDISPTLLRRALANHTSRAGYLLALIHHRGDRRYDLDGQPAGIVTPDERTAAQARLDATTQRGQAKAERVRTHKAREEKRRQQREIERKNREAKAARKAEHERIQQKIAARKALLEAQGIKVESRSERKRRLARDAAERARARLTLDTPVLPQARPQPPPSDKPPSQPSPVRLKPLPDSAEPIHQRPVSVEFKKRRRIIPPNEK